MSMIGENGEPFAMHFLREHVYVDAPPEIGLAQEDYHLAKRSGMGCTTLDRRKRVRARYVLSVRVSAQSTDTALLRHGDDYVRSGVRCDVDGYFERVKERCIMKARRLLRPRGVREMRSLGKRKNDHV